MTPDINVGDGLGLALPRSSTGNPMVSAGNMWVPSDCSLLFLFFVLGIKLRASHCMEPPDSIIGAPPWQPLLIISITPGPLL